MVVKVLCLSTHLILHNPLILFLLADGHKHLIICSRKRCLFGELWKWRMPADNCPSYFWQPESVMNGILPNSDYANNSLETQHLVLISACTSGTHGGSGIVCLSSTGFDVDIVNIKYLYWPVILSKKNENQAEPDASWALYGSFCWQFQESVNRRTVFLYHGK